MGICFSSCMVLWLHTPLISVVKAPVFFSYCPFFPCPVFLSFNGILMGIFFSICSVLGDLNVRIDG